MDDNKQILWKCGERADGRRLSPSALARCAWSNFRWFRLVIVLDGNSRVQGNPNHAEKERGEGQPFKP
jgi:hypothetical protein